MLLLASSNIFLAFLCTVLILLRLGSGETDSFIVQYRPNLGIGAFQSGTALDMASFIAFAVIIAVLSILLSIKAYRIRRALSALILTAGTVLLLMAIVISNALMGLR